MKSETKRFSIVIPLYNRPSEITELLESILLLSPSRELFEVIVVEDGSSLSSASIVEGYGDRMDVRYIYQENTGPGGARNRGVQEAQGEWVIFLDSDVILPPSYLQEVSNALSRGSDFALWGGPDRAHESFTTVQQAIDYSMTSFLTTGGIRGGKKRLDKFYPRSFNMGVLREAFESVGGFAPLRFGEDLDLSMRLLERGEKSQCLEEAWVYHKRRVSWRQFFRQVYNSGIARITLSLLHPGTLKWVHLLPSLFLVGHVLLLLLALFWTPYVLISTLLYALAIVIDVFVRTGWMDLAFHAVIAAYLQHFAYGAGFLQAFWQRIVRGKGNFTRFEENFYD